MPPSSPPQSAQLGAELRRLRSLSGLTTRTVAARTGPSNARVSRVELGQSLLPLPEIEAWVAAVSADTAAHHRLRRLAEAAHGTVEPPRLSVQRREHLESDAVTLETRAGRVVTVRSATPSSTAAPAPRSGRRHDTRRPGPRGAGEDSSGAGVATNGTFVR